MKKTITIIIPCHNEEGNVAALYETLNNELDHEAYAYSYLFINDGSSDNTIGKLNELSSDKKVKIIDFSRNFGKEAALLAGLDNSNSDAAIIIDADLQMPIKYINELIVEWEKGHKLVLTHKKSRAKGLKNSLAQNYYKVYNKFSNTNIIVNALDFQLMDREVVQVLCQFREFNRFFKGLTGYIGYDYSIVEVEIVERNAGESDFSSYKSLFSYAFSSIVAHSTIPLQMGFFFGTLLAAGAFIYMLIIIVQKLFFDMSIPGYSSIMVILLFGFSITYILMSIIGLYIGSIYDEMKKRPVYIVKNKINMENDERY